MDFESWAALAACAGEAALLVLLLVRWGRSPLALQLVVVAAVLFTWNLSSLAYHHTGAQAWSNVDLAASPLTAPAALYLVLRFVGKTRRFRLPLLAVSAALGALSASAVAAFFFPAAERFLRSSAWPTVHLVLAAPVIVFGFVLLGRHLHASIDPLERSRTRLLISAALVVAVGGLTEILAGLGLELPRLGAVGTFVFTALAAAMALRLRLFGGEDFSRVAGLQLLALTAVALIAYVIAFSLLSANGAALLAATAVITVAAGLAGRAVWRQLSERRKRLEGTLLVGRLASQLAHDLKNPLAALKGACQFLRQERAQGRSLDGQTELLALMEEQVDRLAGVVDRYRRAGRLDLARRQVDVNALVRRVIALQAQSGGAVRVEASLAPALPPCDADPELVGAALDNLLVNSREAMPTGGVVEVATLPAADGICISVKDTGEGMDARTREAAFDPLFTTRAAGSGLGLAFVRQVVEAHGGQVTLTSELSRGTEVRLLLPRVQEAAHG